MPDTYVIWMHGGGGCSSEVTCKKWAKAKGSSKDFDRTQTGEHAGMAGDDCTTNPYFCNATAAIVPYCTGDGHRGNNTVASKATFGWIFDGHANFVAIIEELVSTRGLGNAKRILLTGNSAGGIGVFNNLDWQVFPKHSPPALSCRERDTTHSHGGCPKVPPSVVFSLSRCYDILLLNSYADVRSPADATTLSTL